MICFQFPALQYEPIAKITRHTRRACNVRGREPHQQRKRTGNSQFRKPLQDHKPPLEKQKMLHPKNKNKSLCQRTFRDQERAREMTAERTRSPLGGKVRKPRRKTDRKCGRKVGKMRLLRKDPWQLQREQSRGRGNFFLKRRDVSFHRKSSSPTAFVFTFCVKSHPNS